MLQFKTMIMGSKRRAPHVRTVFLNKDLEGADTIWTSSRRWNKYFEI